MKTKIHLNFLQTLHELQKFHLNNYTELPPLNCSPRTCHLWSNLCKKSHWTLYEHCDKELLFFSLNDDRKSVKYSYAHMEQPSERERCNCMVSHTLLASSETVCRTSTLGTDEPLRLFAVWACALSKHRKASAALHTSPCTHTTTEVRHISPCACHHTLIISTTG